MHLVTHFFVFNNILYKQIDDLGMRLPLSGCLSNIFLCYHESIWLENCPIEFKPVFYKRYLDNTFILFNGASHAPLFLEYMNSKHPNIDFTIENEQACKIAFLDVLITRFNTAVNRKPTFSGQGLSFFSNCTFRFKANSIKTLLHRAFNICSSYLSFHDELLFLKNYFHDNGYPKTLIENIINKFLSAKYDPPSDVEVVTKPKLFFKLPFYGYQSEKMKNDILSLFNKYFNEHHFNIVLSNNFSISSLFRYKDKLNKGMTAGTVYKWSCPNCRVHYIASSTRNLYVRASEHAGVSFRTGQHLSHPPHSSIRDHALDCNSFQHIRVDNFNIIGTSRNSTELRILESIFIHKTKPPLNNTQSAVPLYIVK